MFCLQKNNINRFGDYCLHSGTFYDLVVLVYPDLIPRIINPEIEKAFADPRIDELGNANFVSELHVSLGTVILRTFTETNFS